MGCDGVRQLRGTTMVVPVAAVRGLQQPGVATGIDAGMKSVHETADDIVAARDIGRDRTGTTPDGGAGNVGGIPADHVVPIDHGACIDELDPGSDTTSLRLPPAN